MQLVVLFFLVYPLLLTCIQTLYSKRENLFFLDPTLSGRESVLSNGGVFVGGNLGCILEKKAKGKGTKKRWEEKIIFLNLLKQYFVLYLNKILLQMFPDIILHYLF